MKEGPSPGYRAGRRQHDSFAPTLPVQVYQEAESHPSASWCDCRSHRGSLSCSRVTVLPIIQPSVAPATTSLRKCLFCSSRANATEALFA